MVPSLTVQRPTLGDFGRNGVLGKAVSTAGGRIMVSSAMTVASASRTLAGTATHCLNTLLQRPHWGIKPWDSRIPDPDGKPGSGMPE